MSASTVLALSGMDCGCWALGRPLAMRRLLSKRAVRAERSQAGHESDSRGPRRRAAAIPGAAGGAGGDGGGVQRGERGGRACRAQCDTGIPEQHARPLARHATRLAHHAPRCTCARRPLTLARTASRAGRAVGPIAAAPAGSGAGVPAAFRCQGCCGE
ncbi:unnamed protein product [Closterium sp. NIES-53]